MSRTDRIVRLNEPSGLNSGLIRGSSESGCLINDPQGQEGGGDLSFMWGIDVSTERGDNNDEHGNDDERKPGPAGSPSPSGVVGLGPESDTSLHRRGDEAGFLVGHLWHE